MCPKTSDRFTTILVSFIAVICACIACTIADPTANAGNFNSKAAQVVQAVTIIEQTTDDLLNAHAITKQDAQQVVTMSRSVIEAVQVARALQITDQAAGSAKLNLALQSVSALQTYLVTKKGK